jgi:hypothetical protein
MHAEARERLDDVTEWKGEYCGWRFKAACVHDGRVSAPLCDDDGNARLLYEVVFTLPEDLSSLMTVDLNGRNPRGTVIRLQTRILKET